MSAISRYNTEARMSDSTTFAGLVYFVEVPADASGDMTAQTHDMLACAEKTMAASSTHKGRLLSATIYVTSMEHKAAFDLVWDAWLPKGTAPSRCCVQAQLANPAYLVEIAFVAAKEASVTSPASSSDISSGLTAAVISGLMLGGLGYLAMNTLKAGRW
jgi:enamine deaminase RidA (YjgF/YER057c/UK114 family)